jgi:hypothetical protein
VIDDEDNVIVVYIDLSSALDLININLLIRLKIIGLPSVLIDLNLVWLRSRLFYVSIDGENSISYNLLLGTGQGLVLGPILGCNF